MKTRTRITTALVALVVGIVGAVACAGTQAQAACAMEAKSQGATKSPGVSRVAAPAPKTSPPKTATASSGGGVDRSKTPDPPAYPAGGGAPNQPERRPPPPTKTYTRNTQQQDRAAKVASNPKAKPDTEDVTEARDEAPRHVTRGGTYVSNITNRTYIYHDRGYYGSPGYLIDIWDPYDPYNYWLRPRSPFYGMPYRVAGDCSQKDNDPPPEQPQNINIQVTADGHVAGTAPVTTAPGPTTTTTTTPPVGADGNEAPPTTIGTEVVLP